MVITRKEGIITFFEAEKLASLEELKSSNKETDLPSTPQLINDLNEGSLPDEN